MEFSKESLPFIEQFTEEIMPGGFFIYRADETEELVYANSYIFSLYGCQNEEEFRALTGNCFRGMVYEEDYHKISRDVVAQARSDHRQMDFVEYRVRRRDGSLGWVEDYGHLVHTEGQGDLFYVLLYDVTEKKRMLDQDRAVYHAVVSAMSRRYFVIWLIDDLEKESFRLIRGRSHGEDIHAYPNRAAMEKRTYSEAMNDYVNTMVMEQDKEKFREELQLNNLVEKASKDGLYSFTYQRKVEGQGVYYRIEVAKNVMPNGKVALVMGFVDVDEEIRMENQIQKALEEAYETANAANRAKSDFLASMSHDIRTPMNGIIGMTAIASSHLDDQERVKDCLKKITASSKHLLSLINDVLDMNKIESGKLELKDEEINLSDLIENLLSMTRTLIKEHDHKLIVKMGEIEHERVIGDSLHIQQVFMNLMSNAIKYTPNGGRITLEISEKDAGDSLSRCYEFIFEDNGYGMTPEFVEKIFEPFSRAESTAGISGTGLGMAITRNIVRMMGGDIKVESLYGSGSRFTVTLFLKVAGDQVERTDLFQDLHVLVVDDDPQNCENVCSLMDDLGMVTEFALSGASGVDRVKLRHEQGRDFFAVVLDWRMPTQDGLITAKKIRSMAGDQMPIVIMSAYDWSEIEQDARMAGATHFLGKPVFRSRLVKVFEKILGVDEPAQVGLDHLQELSYAGHRVLLAEDQLINAEIAKELLGMTGLEVDWVENGKACVNRLSEVEDDYYDLIFMDIQMPVMNGYQAATAIRALDREYAKRVPIIAMTANAFAEDVHAAKVAGMNEHVAKPLDLSVLARVLRRWVLHYKQ